MSRLPFAPIPKEIEITDIKSGIGIFTPRADFAVSFAVLKGALKKAGYALGSAKLTARGKVLLNEKNLFLIVGKQRFLLEGEAVKSLPVNEEIEVIGDWKTVGIGTAAQEIINVAPAAKKSEIVGVVSSEWTPMQSGDADSHGESRLDGVSGWRSDAPVSARVAIVWNDARDQGYLAIQYFVYADANAPTRS